LPQLGHDPEVVERTGNRVAPHVAVLPQLGHDPEVVESIGALDGAQLHTVAAIGPRP